MKKIILLQIVFLNLSVWAADPPVDSEDATFVKISDQEARKSGMSCSEESQRKLKEFPQFRFSDTKLTPVTVSAKVLEFSNNGKDYGAYCYKWPDGESKAGVVESCKGWCVVPKPEGLWSPVIQNHLYKMATDNCKACEANSSQCKGASLLKNNDDSFKFTTLSGGKNILQMGTDGGLLIFQTKADETKDLSKPYLTFQRVSELRIDPNSKDLKEGYINRSTLELINAKKVITISNEQMPSSDNAEGLRLCKEISLESDKCKKEHKIAQSTKYACVEAGKSGVPNPTGGINGVGVK